MQLKIPLEREPRVISKMKYDCHLILQIFIWYRRSIFKIASYLPFCSSADTWNSLNLNDWNHIELITWSRIKLILLAPKNFVFIMQWSLLVSGMWSPWYWQILLSWIFGIHNHTEVHKFKSASVFWWEMEIALFSVWIFRILRGHHSWEFVGGMWSFAGDVWLLVFTDFCLF